MHSFSLLVICGLIYSSSFTLEAEPLKKYTVGDLLIIPPTLWEKDAGVSVSQAEANKPVTLAANGKGGISARPPGQYALTSETTLDLAAENVRGEVTVQIEWFNASGAFLKATKLTTVRDGALKVDALPVAEKAPTNIDAAQFGLKFWLGDGTKCELSRALITGPVVFKTKNVTSVHRYGSKSEVKPERNLELETLDTCWRLRLEPETPVSAFVLQNKVKYNEKGIILANILALNNGSLSVHVLCWNSNDTFLKEVHLIEGITEMGTYEASFAMFADQFPPDTDTISFKVWIGGDKAQACLEGIYYGML